MKQIFLTLLTLLFYSTNASDWVLRSNVPSEAVGLHCLDLNNCYTLSASGWFAYLMKSKDKGLTWDTLHKFDAWDEYSKGQPYLTNVQDLIVIDSSTFYVIFFEDVPFFKKSINGGKSFEELGIKEAPDTLRIGKFAMYNSNIGYAQVGAESFVTFDGWKTSKKINKDNNLHSDGNSEGLFINSSNLLLCIRDTNSTTSNSVDLIIKYNIIEDNFKIIHKIEEETTYAPTKFTKVNESLVYLIGRRKFDGTGRRIDYILKGSGKEFETWEVVHNQINESAFPLQDIIFYDENNGLTFGNAGKVLMTNDGGKTWRYEKPDDIWIGDEAVYGPITTRCTWVNKTPLISTGAGWIYEYTGDFFKFDTEEEKKDFSYVRTNEDSYCYDTEPFELDLLEPKGGIYSGLGVDANIFDPSAVGGGEHNINYKYSAEGFVEKDTNFVIEVFNYIEPPVISRNVDTLQTQYDFALWFENDNLETVLHSGKSFQPEYEATYVAKHIAENSCESEFSDDFLFTYSSVESTKGEIIITNENISISNMYAGSMSNLIISDYLGRNIEVEINGGEIDISSLEKGAYLLSYLFEGKRNNHKFIKK